MNSLLNPAHTAAELGRALLFHQLKHQLLQRSPNWSFHVISVHWQGRLGLIGCVGERIWWCGVSPTSVLLLPNLRQLQLCSSALPTPAGNPERERTPEGIQVTAVTQSPPQELSSQAKFQRSAKPWWSLMGCRRICHLHSRRGYWGYFLPYLTAACWKTGVQPGSLRAPE